MTISATPIPPSSVIGFDREIMEITDAIERFGSGVPLHVAIVAEPMGGRTAIVNDIRMRYGDRVHHLPLDGLMTPFTIPDLSTIPQEIVLIDNCEFLAARHIGGFDLLEDFLRVQSTSKKLFITTWNVYAWQYLNAVLNIAAYYPAVVMLPKMDMPIIRQLILSRCQPGDIQFINEGTTERSMFYSIIHRPARMPFRTTDIQIPWIKLNFSVVFSRMAGKNRVQVSIEDMIFEKINRIAKGNPGVAINLWDSCVKENAISLSAIHESECTLSLDVNESFLLSFILSMRSLHYKDISAIAGRETDIDRVLYRLLQQGLVQENSGFYSISPLLLNCVVEYLRKNRRVW